MTNRTTTAKSLLAWSIGILMACVLPFDARADQEQSSQNRMELVERVERLENQVKNLKEELKKAARTPKIICHMHTEVYSTKTFRSNQNENNHVVVTNKARPVIRTVWNVPEGGHIVAAFCVPVDRMSDVLTYVYPMVTNGRTVKVHLAEASQKPKWARYAWYIFYYEK